MSLPSAGGLMIMPPLLLLLFLLAFTSPSYSADENTDFTRALCGTCPFPWNNEISIHSYPLGLRNYDGVEVIVIGMYQADGNAANIVVRRSSAPIILLLGYSYSMRERAFWNVIFNNEDVKLRTIMTNGPTWAVKCNGETSCSVPVVSHPELQWLYPFSQYEFNNKMIAPDTSGANITAVANCYQCSEWRITEGGLAGCLPEPSPVLIFFLVVLMVFLVTCCCCCCCIVCFVLILLIAGGAGGIAWGMKVIGGKDKKPSSQATEPLLNEMQQQQRQSSSADAQPPPSSFPPTASPATGAGDGAPQVGLVYSNRPAAPPPVRQPQPQPQWNNPPPQQVPYTMMYAQPLQPQSLRPSQPPQQPVQHHPFQQPQQQPQQQKVVAPQPVVTKKPE